MMPSMAQGGNPKVIGDYIVTQHIGTGSFANVWRATHRLTEKEVAIKDIATDRLNKKLQESLRSEISILKRANHPNIIKLYDIIEVQNRIYLVLEYCAGGDLAAYIQQCGRVPQRVARHFMQQLGAGLQALRANNLIHRDLKPQNLLLTSKDGNAVLKIADFGFARSLQPQGLAETLCGSPLYMAPEILQFQKYDAKADLWSVGTILFQLVTGHPPFVGDNHQQLIQNIAKSNDLQFPRVILPELDFDCIDLCRKLLRKNPVERLSFEEFFNHAFLTQQTQQQSKVEVGSTSGRSTGTASTSDQSQEDSLPFLLDEEPQFLSDSPFPNSKNKPVFNSHLLGSFQSDSISARTTLGNLEKGELASKQGGRPLSKIATAEVEIGKQSKSLKTRDDFGSISRSKSLLCEKPPSTTNEDQGLPNIGSCRGGLTDSLDCIEREYVLVNAPETPPSSLGEQSSGKSPVQRVQRSPTPSIPVPISQGLGSRGGRGEAASETPSGSLDSAELLADSLPTRLLSLRNCASVISDLACKKLDSGDHLEAFAIQLVCLAIWQKTLCVCHKWADAVSGGDLSPSDDIVNVSQRGTPPFFSRAGRLEQGAEAAAACARTEEEFFSAVKHAEELASQLTFREGTAEMPDAVEIIFQSALAVGRSAAVDEHMDNLNDAASDYAKAATMMYFLLTEATSLSLNPPLVLTPADRQRLRRYIDALTTRQSQCIAHREILMQHHQQGNPSSS